MKIDGVSSQIDTQAQIRVQTNDEKSSQQGSESNHIRMPIDTVKNNKYAKEELPISEKALIDVIEKANKAIEGPNKRFEFSIHKATHEIMIKIMDNDTGEVIREIPPEKVLDMVAKMWEMAGIIVDERR